MSDFDVNSQAEALSPCADANEKYYEMIVDLEAIVLSDQDLIAKQRSFRVEKYKSYVILFKPDKECSRNVSRKEYKVSSDDRVCFL